MKLVTVAGMAVAVGMIGLGVAFAGFEKLGLLLAIPAIIVNGIAVMLGVFRVFRSALHPPDEATRSSSSENLDNNTNVDSHDLPQ